MAKQPILKFGDKVVDSFGKDLSRVLGELEKRLVDFLKGTMNASGQVDAAILLNSRTAMIQALNQAGYTDLAAAHVAKYPNLASDIKTTLARAKDFPRPILTEASAAVFQGLAKIDLDEFAKIGEGAIDELRLTLYRQAVGNQPFSAMVETIKAATVGLDGKGAPMAKHAYTHANTAVLQFQGEVLRETGENLDADKWEVVGPLDDKTRDECRDALADPVRTEKEWQSSGYWGGAPGGWNCRHQLYPVFS